MVDNSVNERLISVQDASRTYFNIRDIFRDCKRQWKKNDKSNTYQTAKCVKDFGINSVHRNKNLTISRNLKFKFKRVRNPVKRHPTMTSFAQTLFVTWQYDRYTKIIPMNSFGKASKSDLYYFSGI